MLWLNDSIKNIKGLREYCKFHYSNLDPCDIKIIINDVLKCNGNLIDISDYSNAQVKQILNGNYN